MGYRPPCGAWRTSPSIAQGGSVAPARCRRRDPRRHKQGPARPRSSCWVSRCRRTLPRCRGRARSCVLTAETSAVRTWRHLRSGSNCCSTGGRARPRSRCRQVSPSSLAAPHSGVVAATRQSANRRSLSTRARNARSSRALHDCALLREMAGGSAAAVGLRASLPQRTGAGRRRPPSPTLPRPQQGPPGWLLLPCRRHQRT